MLTEEKTTGLAGLILRGGIRRGISALSERDALSGLIDGLSLPAALDRDTLFRAVLEREALMPTGVGAGIALPHPRTPLVSRPEDQFCAIGTLDTPVDWRALDGLPVDIIILIVSASSKSHLRILSALNYFCRQDSFGALIRGGASLEALAAHIEQTERRWEG
ncbi:MAG: PTS sugar transporter subunit IIA [Treponema sp.]|jgi:PTS system nitrogen regulatory IIA component|nr:PTS sugar transporter subunit IIA [Treponema sp.]